MKIKEDFQKWVFIMWGVAGLNMYLEIQLVKIKCLLWKKSSFFSNEPFKSPVWRKNSWKFHFCHCSGVSLLKWGFTAFKYNLWISIILVVSKVTLAWKKTDFFSGGRKFKIAGWAERRSVPRQPPGTEAAASGDKCRGDFRRQDPSRGSSCTNCLATCPGRGQVHQATTYHTSG